MNPNDQVEILNDLITKSYDAEKGYKEAAEKIDNTELKTLFKKFATQRYNFGHQLKDEVKKLGGDIEKGNSIAATAHQTWIDIRTALASNENKVVLNEIIRGESYALQSYQEALDKLPVGTPIYGMLIKQKDSIRSTIDAIELLEVFTPTNIDS